MRFIGVLALLLLAVPSVKADNRTLVTAYNDQGQMADGNYTYYGAIACPPSMPFGTQIQFEGIDGVFTCEDHYSRRLSFRFDISLPGSSVQACDNITGYYNWYYAA